jgi:hypothetical protein
MEMENQILMCPKCSLRSLEFSGISEPWYDAEQDRTFMSFKKVECPMCNWGHENA